MCYDATMLTNAFLQNIPSAHDILNDMYFICYLLNRLNLERKCNNYSSSDEWNNEYDADDYNQYCEKWATDLPWINKTFPNYTSSTLALQYLSSEHEYFKNICTANMRDFDIKIEELASQLLETFKDTYDFDPDSPDELHIMFIAYLQYAFNDLTEDWYTDVLYFIAPLYAIDKRVISKQVPSSLITLFHYLHPMY